VELLDVMREAAQLGHEPGEELVAERRDGVDQVAERVRRRTSAVVASWAIAVPNARHRSSSASSPKKSPRAERGDDRLVLALRRGEHDLHRA